MKGIDRSGKQESRKGSLELGTWDLELQRRHRRLPLHVTIRRASTGVHLIARRGLLLMESHSEPTAQAMIDWLALNWPAGTQVHWHLLPPPTPAPSLLQRLVAWFIEKCGAEEIH